MYIVFVLMNLKELLLLYKNEWGLYQRCDECKWPDESFIVFIIACHEWITNHFYISVCSALSGKKWHILDYRTERVYLLSDLHAYLAPSGCRILLSVFFCLHTFFLIYCLLMQYYSTFPLRFIHGLLLQAVYWSFFSQMKKGVSLQEYVNKYYYLVETFYFYLYSRLYAWFK